MKIRKRDIAFISAFVVLNAILMSVIIESNTLIVEKYLFAIVVMLFIFGVFAYRSINISLQNGLENQFKQLEALNSLQKIIEPIYPLPPTKGWAASPDFLLKIAETINEHSPKIIVEASSGASTIVSAYMLKKKGGGKVYSLEHDSHYAEKTRKMIDKHGLNDYVKIINAPLKEYNIGDSKWKWYETIMLNEISKIELLIIDGPPHNTQKLARYPAIPLLDEKMAEEAIFILDDASRKDEKKIVKNWEQNYKYKMEFLAFEKGCVIGQKEK